MSAANTVTLRSLAPGYQIPRLIRGGWQLAGDHGPVLAQRAVDDMALFAQAGLNTFDCADIYTGVEEMIGQYRLRDPSLQVHTKFVPDLAMLGQVNEAYVRGVHQRSLQRLHTQRLDLVQFHWWDYAAGDLVNAARHLLTLQREGSLRLIGGTNFNTEQTRRMLDAGIPVATMQVQYSLLDRRPSGPMTGLCAQSGMQLLCYGTLAGGFLTSAWLGQGEPALDSLSNRSLIKYKLVIDDFGGWALFQDLLQALAQVAERHGVALSSVATRWVLDQPQVAAAIVGARYAVHLPQMLEVFSLQLDQSDLDVLAQVLARSQPLAGDVYDLERDRHGRHGRIMKYNLSQAAA
jgi:aryl-alcohol dehydrogenase-like predicted oxidoreductase